jgi:hypothetical protein
MDSKYEARTAYNVTIPKYLGDREDVRFWAEHVGPYFPGCRVVMRTKTGVRTIWEHKPEVAAA